MCVFTCVHVCVCAYMCACVHVHVRSRVCMYFICVYVCECVAVCLLPPSGETVLDHSLYQVDHTLDPALVSQLYHYSTAFLSLSWFFETLYKASQELLEGRGGANTQEGTMWEREGVFVACTCGLGVSGSRTHAHPSMRTCTYMAPHLPCVVCTAMHTL